MSNRKQTNRGEGIVRVVGAFVISVLLTACICARNTTSTPSSRVCVNNLRQIEGAIQTWALENHIDVNDAMTWDDIRPYLTRSLHCPDGGKYILGKVGEQPRCSPGEMHKLPQDTALTHGIL